MNFEGKIPDREDSHRVGGGWFGGARLPRFLLNCLVDKGRRRGTDHPEARNTKLLKPLCKTEHGARKGKLRIRSDTATQAQAP
jgi:hypothetical protein